MQQGFSLLELVVVTSVLASLTLVGMQSYANYHGSQRLKLAATQIHTSLVSASALAFSKRKDLWLILQRADSITSLHIADNASGESPLSRIQIEGVTLDATSDSIHIDGFSGDVLGNGNITISATDGQQLKVIYHQMSGRVRVCSPERGSLGYAAC